MPAPRVSVIIPVRDAAATIAEALDSAAGPGVEAIVVLDRCSDDTGAVAARHATRPLVLRSPRPGAAAARNTGIAAARAPFAVFLDADDRFVPGGLARLLEAAGSDVAVSYGDVVTIDEGGARLGSDGPPLFARRPSGDVLADLLAGNVIASTGAACVSRAALDAAGPWREDLARAHDWELWCRMATVGRFVFVGWPAVLERRLHGRSISATLGTDVTHSLRSVEAVFSNPEIQRRIDPRARRGLRTRQEGWMLAVAGTECLHQRRFVEARRLFFRALARRPAPREAILFGCALLGVMPQALRRRLK